jgi:hypothetical protein
LKRLILSAALIMTFVFFSSAPAHESKTEAKPTKEPKVYCCHGKNDCDKIHTKAECEKEGGKVVENCKQCK